MVKRSSYYIGVVGVREVGCYIIYAADDDWPLITSCSASFMLVPNSEEWGTAFFEAAMRAKHAEGLT